jgi:hypothetical protein
MSLETSVNSNLPDSTSITISDLASINCVLGIMKSPEMEATDGVGVPAVAAARGTQRRPRSNSTPPSSPRAMHYRRQRRLNLRPLSCPHKFEMKTRRSSKGAEAA